MVVCLIIGVFLLSCDNNLKEEDVKVTLNYNHKRQLEYPEANFREYYKRPLAAPKLYRHQIDVRDYMEQYIYDSTILNDNLEGSVMVPVNVDLEVDYKNYTVEDPQIHYESGTSDPFSVSHNSPATTTITIPVDINPDHPSQVVEEETVDNVTIETVTTHTLLWSDNFTHRVKSTQSQTQSYLQFWDNASNHTWDNISIGNPDNMTTCDNSSLISEIATNIENSTYEFQGKFCNGWYWTFGKCGWGNELSAFDRSRSDCACLKSTDIGYTIRPLIGNANWGGVGMSCNAQSQTLQVVLKRSSGNSL